ncbi:alanine racemase [Fervidicella metallireducens AeB]|uniref:Alanine racemase n=1 Tax=Fervidicella metallireducens AeB TaxID=1403537 RepID=A0A017RW65_9CLOT|nr:alanine racemase [Fervidicella metallireducens]EYE88856.1 alanine racemase [Fervidicella metallireducens AeB]
MFNNYRPYFAEINLDNFRHNFREVKRLANGKKIFGIIKADGYGHGAVELARILEEEGADYFGVAVITEALELRKNGFKTPILILGFTPPNYAKDIVEHDITQAVFSYELAKAISDEAVKQNKNAKIHIKLDTGMGRVGYLPDEKAVDEIIKISQLRNIKIEGIFTHFASADERDKEFTKKQIERYKCIIENLQKSGIYPEIKHVANSAAIIDLEESYFDAVRPGIMLYGYYPSDEVRKERVSLKPVMTLKANIVHVKNVDKDTPISYGRKFKTEKPSKIATLPFGYADGYTRLLFEKGMVIVNGKMAPVIGRICMDQCMIDVSECGDVNVGDEVVVMGEKDGVKNDAEDIARKLGTISYEILCMVSKRVPRIYFENNELIKIKNYV